MKKAFALLLTLTMLLTACSAKQPDAPAQDQGASPVVDPNAPTVGVLLPDEQPDWLAQGEQLTKKLQELGYNTTVVYAENDPQRQNLQLRDQIGEQADCLVVAAVDSFALSDSITLAKASGIPVVAYDRLLLQTDGLDCYVGFDSFMNGVAVGDFVVQSKQLQLAAEEGLCYTVELFMDSPENYSALEFYWGVLSVLQPYLDSGVLTCSSGYLAFEDACIQDGDAKAAEKQCTYLLNRCYLEKMPDIILTASDSLTAGVCAALDTAQCPVESWPLVVGQGLSEETEARMQAGKQMMTVVLDRDALADTCAQQVQALLTQQFTGGETVCDNGVIQVPAFLLKGKISVIENYHPEDENDTQSG